MNPSPKKIFISTGELSGDMLGAELVESIRSIYPQASFYGLTGPHLRAAGVTSVADNGILSVMGIADAIKRYPKIKSLESQVLTMIERIKPEVVIMVDAPGFHFQLAEKLRVIGVPCCQYVAPKLWAWGAHRSKRLARDFDLVLGVLPFEKDFFLKRGVPYQFVGSPHRDRIEQIKKSFSPKSKSLKSKTIACLPGSRSKEFLWMVDIIFEQKKRLPTSSAHSFNWIVPIASSLSLSDIKDFLRKKHQVLDEVPSELAETFSDLDLSGSFVVNGVLFVLEQSIEVLLLADVALAASGTVTLEAALTRTPTVVVYKIDDLTYELAKVHVKIKYISLPNLMLGEEVFPEFVQEIDSAEVSRELLRFCENPDLLASHFDKIYNDLEPKAAAKAASIICERYLQVE